MYLKKLTYFFALLLVIFIKPGETFADYWVKGSFIYKDKIITTTSIFSEVKYLPIRFALVEIYDDNTGEILASSVTDNDGKFEVFVQDGTQRNIKIRCISSMEYNGSSAAEIADLDGNLFALTGEVYSDHLPSIDIDFTTSPVSASEDEIGGAFNILDCAVNTVKYLIHLNDDFSKSIRVLWEKGAYEGTGYVRSTNTIYLLGLDSDSDDYDDPVIYHELGHFAAIQFARDDNPGVSHYITERYPLDISWSEGWANFFSSEVRRFLNFEYSVWYFDTMKQSGTYYKGVEFELETPSLTQYATGSDNEISVAAILWDITDNENTSDDSPGEDDDSFNISGAEHYVWSSLLLFKSSSDPATLELFWNNWNSDILNLPMAEEFGSILLSRGVEYIEDTFEDDDSSKNGTIVNDFGQPESHTFYDKYDTDWYKIPARENKVYEIKTLALRNGADTYIELYRMIEGQLTLIIGDIINAKSIV